MVSLPHFSSVVPRHRARVRSPEFHHFPVLARTLLRYSPGPFSGTRPDFTRFRYSLGPFSGTHPDFTRFRYLPETFSGTRPDPFSVLARSFFGTCPKPSPVLTRSFLRYSPGPFSGTRPNFTRFRYSPGFHHFSVLAWIPLFFGTCPNPSPVLARIKSLIFTGIVIGSPFLFLRHRA